MNVAGKWGDVVNRVIYPLPQLPILFIRRGSGVSRSGPRSGMRSSNWRSSSPSITSISSSRRVTVSSFSRCSVRMSRALLCASVRMRLISASIFCAVSSPYRPALLRHRDVQKPRPLVAVVVDRAQRVAHAELGDHRARDVGGALQVVLRAGRNLAERDLFGRASAQQHGELTEQIAARHQIPILERQLHRVAERAEAALHDRDLVHRVEARQHGGDDGVAGLVVGHDLALLRAHHALSSRGPPRAGRSPTRNPACRPTSCRCGPRAAPPRSRDSPGRRRQIRRCGPRRSSGPRRAPPSHLCCGSAGSLRVPSRRACRRAPGGRSGPGAAAPDRALPAGWWRP